MLCSKKSTNCVTEVRPGTGIQVTSWTYNRRAINTLNLRTSSWKKFYKITVCNAIVIAIRFYAANLDCAEVAAHGKTVYWMLSEHK